MGKVKNEKKLGDSDGGGRMPRRGLLKPGPLPPSSARPWWRGFVERPLCHENSWWSCGISSNRGRWAQYRSKTLLE